MKITLVLIIHNYQNFKLRNKETCNVCNRKVVLTFSNINYRKGAQHTALKSQNVIVNIETKEGGNITFNYRGKESNIWIFYITQFICMKLKR